MNPPKISIVVPVLNEAANLRLVLPGLPDVHEIILVDGGSVDHTIETAQQVRPEIKILQQTRRGKGNALVCGFEAATGDIIVMFDADGSADPQEIPRFVDALVKGADYAKGTRFCKTDTGRAGSDDISLIRMAGNAGLNAVANLLFRTRFSDLCYGYNAFWRGILPLLHLPPVAASDIKPDQLLWGDGFEIEAVLSCRVAAAHLRVTEVPSLERCRIHGASNLRTFSDGTRVLRTLVNERVRARHLRRAARPALAGRPAASRSGLEPPSDLLTTTPSSYGGERQTGRVHLSPLRSSTGGAPRALARGKSQPCAGYEDVRNDS